jgi:hypothetical protein
MFACWTTSVYLNRRKFLLLACCSQEFLPEYRQPLKLQPPGFDLDMGFELFV